MIQEVGNIELFELLETDPQNAVQSMPIILECRHRLFHMRAFLAANRGQSTFHHLYEGTSFTSRVCHQEGKTSRPQIWEKVKRQRIFSGLPIEKEMPKEGFPRNP